MSNLNHPLTQTVLTYAMKTTRSFKIITVLLLLFPAWILLAWLAAERLIVEQPIERAEAILVLGGSAAYIERTQKAVQLFKNNVSPKIFLTNDGTKAGWSKRKQRNLPYVELAERSLIGQGISKEKYRNFADNHRKHTGRSESVGENYEIAQKSRYRGKGADIDALEAEIKKAQ